MSGVETRIGNSELLTNIFGAWPSFHDAEVISIELEREGTGASGATLIARIYVCEPTKEADARGFSVLKNHTIVTFAFRDIDDSSIVGFNHQNVLWELSIQDLSASQLERLTFQVHFSSSFGVDAEFKCRSIDVLAADRSEPLTVGGLPRQSHPRAGAHSPK